ncbi:MAG TPA: hypothetical protein VOA87_11440 [Thermoanaerobaculia bacterium]|nr:hypothetical protein [Thermoanaerobaculia bacterium]
MKRPALAAAALFGAAALASALLHHYLPLPANDPFRRTLVVLPLLLASFGALRRQGERLGGRPLARAGTVAEVATLGLLALLAYARTYLGLPWSDEVLAAGFALVLASRLARQVMALRPLLGATLPDRPSALFFALPLLAYLAILPWSAGHREPDGDEPFNLLLTYSLAYDFDADLTNNYAAGDWRHFMSRPIAPQPGDPVGPHGELFSRHNELLPLALAPAYRLAGKAGALATMAALTAALAWMTLRLARHYARELPGEALAAYALVAFAPPLLLYSYQVWVEVPAALLAMLALDHILYLHRRPADQPIPGAPPKERSEAQGSRHNVSWGRKEWLGIGLPVLLLPLLKIRFLLLAGPLLAMGWWHAGRSRRPVWILALLLVAVAGGILLHNSLLYANPLKIHSWQELELNRYSPEAFALGGLGLFYDAAFGLFGCAPLWLLLLPAALLLLARRSPLLVHLAVLTIPYFLIVTPRSEWYGGWSPPFRYALIALPMLGLALVPLLARRHRPGARALLAGLAALTLALALLWIVVPGWTYNFAHGRTYPLDRLAERLDLDLARLFPSSVRPRAATWVWPPVTFLLVPLVWWIGGRGSVGPRAATGSAPRPALAVAETIRGAPPKERSEVQRSHHPTAAYLWGIAGLLVAAAILPIAVARLPTRVIELEDPQVGKSGGHLYPEPWVIERTLYRGGWALRVGERLSAPVVPGGRRVRLILTGELIRNQPVPFTLDVYAGDRLLGAWTPRRQRAWETVALGPVDWPAGAPLVLAARGPHPPGDLNGAILDRVDLDWK